MKNLLIVLLFFVSAGAQGQHSASKALSLDALKTITISGDITNPIAIQDIPIRVPLPRFWQEVPLECNCSCNPKVGDIKRQNPAITRLVQVVVKDNGAIKMIDAYKIVTTQKYTHVYINPNVYTGKSITAATVTDYYTWEDNDAYYTNMEGAVIKEVYQLIKLN